MRAGSPAGRPSTSTAARTGPDAEPRRPGARRRGVGGEAGPGAHRPPPQGCATPAGPQAGAWGEARGAAGSPFTTSAVRGSLGKQLPAPQGLVALVGMGSSGHRARYCFSVQHDDPIFVPVVKRSTQYVHLLPITSHGCSSIHRLNCGRVCLRCGVLPVERHFRARVNAGEPLPSWKHGCR